MGWHLPTTAAAVFFVACLTNGQSASKTFFEEKLLDRAPVIVRAQFDVDQSCFDVDVAAFKVIRHLRGETEARILVLGAAQLSRRGRDLERLLFLEKKPSGCLYRIVDVIELAEDAAATESFVKSFLALIDDADPARRRAALKQAIKDGFGIRAEFPRKLAVREFDRVARRVPSVLTLEEVAEYARLGQELTGDDATRMADALDAAENGILRDLAGTQTAFARGARRQSYVKSVAEYLRDSDPVRRDAVMDQIALRFGVAAAPFLMKLLDDAHGRTRAALHLGAMQWAAAAPRLVAILSEPPPDPAPFIASLGEIGSDAAVPAVSRYLSSADHFDAAVLALGRIGTPAASKMLDALAKGMRRDPRQASRVDVIEKARSPEFLRADADRRAEARARYPRE